MHGQAVGSTRSACPGRLGSNSLVQPQRCRPGSSVGQRGQAGAGEGFFWDGRDGLVPEFRQLALLVSRGTGAVFFPALSEPDHGRLLHLPSLRSCLGPREHVSSLFHISGPSQIWALTLSTLAGVRDGGLAVSICCYLPQRLLLLASTVAANAQIRAVAPGQVPGELQALGLPYCPALPQNCVMGAKTGRWWSARPWLKCYWQ